MTKHKEKEEDIIEQKDIKKEVREELREGAEGKEEEKAEKLPEAEKMAEQALESVSAKASAGDKSLADKLADEYLDGWKRCKADFENYKKRQSEALKDLALYSNENIILQILPVLDNFHASTGHIPEAQKNDPWVVGIMHIRKQLEKVLEDNGVSEIEVKEGNEFDPAVHEAVSNGQKKKELKNRIAKVIRKGYKVGERIIRPARVIVE